MTATQRRRPALPVVEGLHHLLFTHRQRDAGNPMPCLAGRGEIEPPIKFLQTSKTRRGAIPCNQVQPWRRSRRMASAFSVVYDPNTAEALLEKHRKLVYFATKRYIRARPDLEEDILAVARADLVEAAKAYRPDAGAAFTTFAVNRMRWAVSRFMREFTRHDRFTKSLNEPVAYEDEGELTLADLVDRWEGERKTSESLDEERRLRRIDDLRRAIAECRTLTPSERKVLEAFLETGNQTTVAARLRVTQQHVGQAMAKSFAKLRTTLLTGTVSR